MTQAYKVSILYFLVFALILLLSTLLVFEHKIGFSIQSITTYYVGDTQNYIPAKTYLGILKTTSPHFVAIGLFCMVLLHFLVFSKSKHKQRTKLLVYGVFVSALFEICSPFFILFELEVFAYIKLLSLALLEVLLLYTLWLLFHSIVYE